MHDFRLESVDVPDWTFLYLLSEWTIRLVMLLYVPQRRSPNAARAWLLLIFVQPWIGLVLYSMLGRAFLPRRRLQMQQQIAARIRDAVARLKGHVARPELPAQFRESVTLAENLGDFPIMGGNRLELLSDYRASVQRLIDDLDAATHSVNLLYYIFADDKTGNQVIDAVARATRRGVVCRVLIDSMGSKPWRRRVLTKLRDAGAEAIAVLPFTFKRRGRARFDLRNHRKIAVIDGRIGYIGSQNLVDADFKPGIVYKELVVRIEGPVVLQLQAVLLADRFMDCPTPIDEKGLFPAPSPAGATFAQALPSGPGYPLANNQRLIVALLYAAQRRVVLTTPYFIPDAALLQALQTAVLRGVEVHLVVSRKPDQVLVGLGQRSYYEELLEAGVQIHEYLPGLLHAKHLSIDDSVAVIGSSNLDIRSFQLNAEISLIIYDPAVNAELRREQERNLADAEQLQLAAWRHRPWLAKATQNIARLFDSVL